MPDALGTWRKVALGVAVMLLLALAVQQKWLEHLSDSHWVAAYVRQSGPVALLWLSFSGVVFTAVGGPRQRHDVTNHVHIWATRQRLNLIFIKTIYQRNAKGA